MPEQKPESGSSYLRAMVLLGGGDLDPDQQALEVEFHNGSQYRYEHVPAEAVQALLEADSLGRHFNQVFKPQHYRYRRID